MKNSNYNKIVIESQDLIRNIDGLTGSDAFEEIVKIIFTMNLSDGTELNPQSLRETYKNKLFKNYDFFIGEEIKLKDITITQILSLYSQIDFKSEDVKGRLFETYLGRVFTSGLGQFFTPREIVEFITGYLKKKNLFPSNAKIIDPACGSSGILLSTLSENPFTIYGYDINERLVRVSKMNMVLHGVKSYEIKNQSFLESDEENIYDVCVTNPPFGVEEKQKEILDKFIFGYGKKNCDLEILFIEKIIKVLKPGGVCGIVLPDGVFNNITLLKLREHILQTSEIIASVDLPENVFKASGTGCETGILFFRKKVDSIEKKVNFEAYKVDEVGYERKTKFAKKIKENDLQKIVNEVNIQNVTTVKELNKTKRFDGKFYIRKSKNLSKGILDIFTGSGQNISKVYRDESEIIKYVQYTDIDPVFGVIKSFTEIELSEAPSRAKIVVHTGDILIPKLKQSVDKIALVTEEYDGCVVTNGFKVIKPKNNHSSEFIFGLFRNKEIYEQLYDFSSGTIMPSIDDDYFEELATMENLPNEIEMTKKVKEIFQILELAKNKMKELSY